MKCRKNLILGRKFKRLLVSTLLAAVMAITSVPATVMAAEAEALPAEIATSYSQVTENEVKSVNTSYFIHDQEFSFAGAYTTPAFYVPSACEARMVIAAVGSETLYIDVLNGKGQCENTITVTPNQSQLHVFNISAGTHSLDFRSSNSSTFTVRISLYTWDY